MSRGLTATQSAVLELVASGMTSNDIAVRLAMSPATVETHVRAAMERLGARTRLHAAALAQLGLASRRPANHGLSLELQSDEHRLLRLIAAGATMNEAATSLHVSRRTGVRRLATARKKLGVLTTAEAVLRVARSHASSLRTSVFFGLQAAADALDSLDALDARVALVCLPF